MAEETKQTEEVVEEVDQEEVDTQETTEQQQEEVKTYTQDELEEIVKSRVARKEKEKERAVEEAKKLAKMNEEEKREHEYKKLQEELAELKRKDAFYGLSKEASKMFKEFGIDADESLLEVAVKEDAETTKSSVTSVAGIINKHIEEGVKKALSGKAPKFAEHKQGKITKESIMAIKDAKTRVKAIQENPQLFN